VFAWLGFSTVTDRLCHHPFGWGASTTVDRVSTWLRGYRGYDKTSASDSTRSSGRT